MPQKAGLRNSAEFRIVYETGKRFDSRLMTVFIRANDLGEHRFGVTASRKMAGLAVDRNRAKRLLREAFRQSRNERQLLRETYDWVFNARRAILDVKMDAVLEELRGVITQVMKRERDPQSEAGS